MPMQACLLARLFALPSMLSYVWPKTAFQKLALKYRGSEVARHDTACCVQVVLFGEYFRSSTRSYIFLVTMLVMFVVAVGLLIGSAGHRDN